MYIVYVYLYVCFSLGCDLCGSVSKDQISDGVVNNPNSVFSVGQLVTVKVLM